MAKGTILSTNGAAFAPFNRAYQFDFNDLKTSGFLSSGSGGVFGAANQIKIGSLKPNEIVTNIGIVCRTAAGGDTAFTIDIGNESDNSDPDTFVDAFDLGGLAVNTVAVASLVNNGGVDSATDRLGLGGGAAGILHTSGDKAIIAEFTNLDTSSISAGEWTIVWNVAEIPNLV